MSARPLPPTGAPGLGDPPVSLRAIGRRVERAGEAGAPELLRRDLPTLSEQEREEGLRGWLADPEAATPRPTWGQALSLVPAVAGGALLSVQGLIAGAGFVLLLILAAFGFPLRDQSAVAFLLGSMIVATAFALGLHRFAPWAARLTGALGAIAAAGSMFAAPIDLGFVALLPTAAGLALLLHPACGRWFTPEGSAAAQALPLAPYRTAVAAAGALLWVAVLIVPAFQKMFAETGLALPAGTKVLLSITRLMRDWAFLMPPLIAIAPLPLLRLPARLERPADLAASLAFVACLGSIGGWLLLPVIDLLQKL